MQTPPDPEDMNGFRSEWAEHALREFTILTECDRQDALCDLLCDLAHWCDRNGFQFSDELRRARMHYNEETGGQGTQMEGSP